MGVPTINTSTWFGAGTASTAVLTPAQVAAVAPLVRVTAAYVVMYYAFCFFQSWSKLYLSASRRPSLFFPYVDSCSCASSTRGGGVLLPLASAAAMACRARHREIGTAAPPHRLGRVGSLCARSREQRCECRSRDRRVETSGLVPDGLIARGEDEGESDQAQTRDVAQVAEAAALGGRALSPTRTIYMSACCCAMASRSAV